MLLSAAMCRVKRSYNLNARKIDKKYLLLIINMQATPVALADFIIYRFLVPAGGERERKKGNEKRKTNYVCVCVCVSVCVRRLLHIIFAFFFLLFLQYIRLWVAVEGVAISIPFAQVLLLLPTFRHNIIHTPKPQAADMRT